MSIRVREDIFLRLEQLAVGTQHSKNEVIQSILEYGLDHVKAVNRKLYVAPDVLAAAKEQPGALCERLKQLRIAHYLTQQRVADRLGVDRSTYAYYECGKSTPPLKILCALAELFGVSLDDLLGRKDNSQ